jgi:hypothetical protein
MKPVKKYRKLTLTEDHCAGSKASFHPVALDIWDHRMFFWGKTTGKISLFLCQLHEGLLSKSLKSLGMEMPVFT